MAYNHGVQVIETPTSAARVASGTAGLQVVFGTAPINLAENPLQATNRIIVANSLAEAIKALGYSREYDKYTLCQSMHASFELYNIAPVVFVNVLDPAKHSKKNEEQSIPISGGQGKVETLGIMKNTVVVKNGQAEVQEGEDYLLSFDDDGYLIISIVPTGAALAAQTLTVASSCIDPTMVTPADIIGGVNVDTGAETGLELIRQVYPVTGMTAGLLLAPGYSKTPAVSSVMQAKCSEINGLFQCECLIDIDTGESGAKVYTDVSEAKVAAGITSPHAVALWPMVKVGDKVLSYSALFGALTAYTDVVNGDVPTVSPSNKLMSILGTCLADGTDVLLDQMQANSLNAKGVVTALNMGGWKSWGNNTAAYPANTDPKDRWFAIRRAFTWWGNSFILTYSEKVDSPANYRLIESIVDAENIRGNSYVSQGKFAGAKIEYLPEENPVTSILDGKLKFHISIAPYIPSEFIVADLEFDPNMLVNALNGGEA